MDIGNAQDEDYGEKLKIAKPKRKMGKLLGGPSLRLYPRSQGGPYTCDDDLRS